MKRSHPCINVVLRLVVIVVDVFWTFFCFLGRKFWFSWSLPLRPTLAFENFLCLPLCNSQEQVAWRAYLAGMLSMLPFTRSQGENKGLYATAQPISNIHFVPIDKVANFAEDDVFPPYHGYDLLSWGLNFLGNSPDASLLAWMSDRSLEVKCCYYFLFVPHFTFTLPLPPVFWLLSLKVESVSSNLCSCILNFSELFIMWLPNAFVTERNYKEPKGVI